MKEKTDFKEENLIENNEERFLVLHNDDIHTFDYVIDTLIDICNHNTLQAEQCTMLIHFKGKCAVKEGSFDTLKPIREKLVQKELNATID